MSIRKQLFLLAFTAVPFVNGSIAEAGGCGHGGGHFGGGSIGRQISQHIQQHISGSQYGGGHSHVHVQQPTYVPHTHLSVPQPVYVQSVPATSYTQVSGYGSVPAGYPAQSNSYPSSNVPPPPSPAVVSPNQNFGQNPAQNPGPNGAQANPAPRPVSTGAATELTALQLLASMQSAPVSPAPQAIPQPVPQSVEAAASPNQPAGFASAVPADGHIGLWQVTLPNNQSILLNLSADNSFSWVATKEGKSTSFEGQFRVEGSRLILVRASDLQQMTGDWMVQDGRFTFKLDGATDGGLAFSRAN